MKSRRQALADRLSKPKHYKRHARRGVAEAMLGPAVIVAEGVTEFAALRRSASIASKPFCRIHA
jgi:hypothetical protein